MEMEKQMLTGGCHCGAVRYEVLAQPQRHTICHCTDCRRCAGAPMVAWALFGAAEVRITKGVAKEYASSDHGRRYFCETCGAGLFYTSEVIFSGLIDVQSASLDSPEAIMPPSAQVQTAERIGWLHEALQSPAFERYPAD